MPTKKMIDIIPFRGTLRVLGSGLRIGGSGDIAGIGETDNPIIRHPISGLPYVPGSSIKGKVRSLLEQKHNKISEGRRGEGGPCKCGDCLVCRLFGCHDSKKTKSPTRLTFRDCQPTEKTIEVWENSGTSSEVKTEVLIDRKTGTSYGNIGPRSTERIPAGSDFHFSFSIRYFEDDNLHEMLDFVAEGFELMERHYLGGAGSRGYGEVAIVCPKEGGDENVPLHEYLRSWKQGE